MSRNGLWVAALLAVTIGVLGALGSGTRTADAKIPGDVCRIAAWDSNGNVIEDGGTVGGDGSVYLVFRVEDDPFGYVNDFILEGPVQEVLATLEQEIADLEEDIAELDPEEDAQEIAELEIELAALLEVQAEYIEAIEGVLDSDLVQIDSSTGSARITSKAEVVGFEWVRPNVAHLLVQPGVGSQRVDHFFPTFINDADGHELNSIRAWLVDVGVPDPGALSSLAPNVCGSSTDDGWGFVDIKCIEAGRFRVNVIPQRGTTENTRGTIDMYCPGEAESADMVVQRSTVETHPTNVPPHGFGNSLITVRVYDQTGARFDGAMVTFTTDNCHFDAGAGISPAGGGQTVVTYSDTDTSADSNFLADNTLEKYAGTAEVTLDCTGSDGKPGVANVTAIVERRGADIVLKETITVVGPTSATGLTLTLTPDDIECGETILAVATAVDAQGKPVSDGTMVYFTTDTSSGVVGGIEGAQGGVATKGGEASVLIATDPGNPGVHTVIAYTLDQYGRVHSQVSKNYVCDGAVAPVAPTVAPPNNGTGTGSITPPNTGSAGLADGNAASSLWLAGAVAIVAALVSGLGLAVVRSR